MKKIILVLVLLSFVFCPALALAQDETFSRGGGYEPTEKAKTDKKRGGGYSGPNSSLLTVQEALKLNDDALVTLRGKIEKQLGDEVFLFSDETGSVQVEIEDKRWRGQVISEKDLVEIYGKIDKDRNKFEIEVKRLTKL